MTLLHIPELFSAGDIIAIVTLLYWFVFIWQLRTPALRSEWQLSAAIFCAIIGAAFIALSVFLYLNPAPSY